MSLDLQELRDDLNHWSSPNGCHEDCPACAAETVANEAAEAAEDATAATPLLKFNCCYAYDVPCYQSFVVEAKSERSALRQIKAALDAGRFANVAAPPCWENAPTNDRVWVHGPQADQHQQCDPMLADLPPGDES